MAPQPSRRHLWGLKQPPLVILGRRIQRQPQQRRQMVAQLATALAAQPTAEKGAEAEQAHPGHQAQGEGTAPTEPRRPWIRAPTE